MVVGLVVVMVMVMVMGPGAIKRVAHRRRVLRATAFADDWRKAKIKKRARYERTRSLGSGARGKGKARLCNHEARRMRMRPCRHRCPCEHLQAAFKVQTGRQRSYCSGKASVLAADGDCRALNRVGCACARLWIVHGAAGH